MATERELKNRIKSVKSTSQITSALAAISASKANRAQARVQYTRAYAAKAMEILNNLAGSAAAAAHPMLVTRDEIKKIAVILITGDRGLAGPYNTDMVRLAENFTDAIKKDNPDAEIGFITIGKKGLEGMVRRGFEVIASFENLPDPPSVLDITPIAQVAVNDYLDGKVDQVFIAFTNFINMVSREASIKQLLPMKTSDFSNSAMEVFFGKMDEDVEDGASKDYSYEPAAELLLDAIVPRFVDLQLYQTLLESLASEHSSRYVAMNNATDNAKALIDDLTLARNKARQSAITAEILDIAGGAEALSG